MQAYLLFAGEWFEIADGIADKGGYFGLFHLKAHGFSFYLLEVEKLCYHVQQLFCVTLCQCQCRMSVFCQGLFFDFIQRSLDEGEWGADIVCYVDEETYFLVRVSGFQPVLICPDKIVHDKDGGYDVCCPCYSCVPPGRPDSHVDGSFLKVLVVTAVEHFHAKSIFAGRDVGVYGMMMVGGQAPFLVKSFQIPAIHIFGSIQVTQVQKAKREGMLVVVKGDMAAAVDSGMKRSFYIRRVCRPVE